ncbi:MAG TPA: carboxymuconolactone decarboxylase family protein [Acidobacteriaceae bacterium]|nr:carboxymuconolactone decarboxylase family protein [Acidobacteriaceae bacterium]
MPRLNYPKLAPEPYNALQSLGHSLRTATTLDAVLLGLIDLRASLLNRCGFCIGMHTAELKHAHEPDSRINAVANWNAPENRDAFTPRERAALAWTDAITNIQESHASDEAYAAATEYFKGKDLVDLTWAIAAINAWNRLGIAFRAEWNPSIRPGVAPTQPPANS